MLIFVLRYSVVGQPKVSLFNFLLPHLAPWSHRFTVTSQLT
uniref:Uncharacterized protein n=1 Tax=Anguilla anguilla TaxID=7936 RepID=A0A0E9SUC3_ANGAN